MKRNQSHGYGKGGALWSGTEGEATDSLVPAVWLGRVFMKVSLLFCKSEQQSVPAPLAYVVQRRNQSNPGIHSLFLVNNLILT